MALFGFGKKKEEAAACECNGACQPQQSASSSCCEGASGESIQAAQAKQGEGASVKVLGSGCKKCNELESATAQALSNLGMNTDIDHVTDFAQIAAYGVMTTPALVVDGKVVAYGKVLKTAEVEALLQKARA